MNPRHYTNKLLEMIDDGILDARQAVCDLAYYMSEYDMEDCMRINGYLEEDEEEASDK